MADLELKRMQVEFKQVNTAREQMEYKIMECQAQIEHLEANIAISMAKEEELKEKIRIKEGK